MITICDTLHATTDTCEDLRSCTHSSCRLNPLVQAVGLNARVTTHKLATPGGNEEMQSVLHLRFESASSAASP